MTQILMAHMYIIGTILLTVFGQLIGKWRMDHYASQVPQTLGGKIYFFATTLMWDPLIIASYTSAFLASFCWLIALSKFSISYAYPFVGASFVLVAIFSVLLFGETLTVYKILGTALIVLGIVMISQSA